MSSSTGFTKDVDIVDLDVCEAAAYVLKALGHRRERYALLGLVSSRRRSSNVEKPSKIEIACEANISSCTLLSRLPSFASRQTSSTMEYLTPLPGSSAPDFSSSTLLLVSFHHLVSFHQLPLHCRLHQSRACTHRCPFMYSRNPP